MLSSPRIQQSPSNKDTTRSGCETTPLSLSPNEFVVLMSHDQKPDPVEYSAKVRYRKSDSM